VGIVENVVIVVIPDEPVVGDWIVGKKHSARQEQAKQNRSKPGRLEQAH
jgi:hypothetical protein